MDIKTALQQAIHIFDEQKTGSKFLDARLLLAKVLNKRQEYILTHYDYNLTFEEEEQFFEFVTRRAKYEPIAYILENIEFYGRNFRVTKDVLIPRPDTEILIDSVLEEYEKKYNNRQINILDLGTGSGAIAIALAAEIKSSQITAIDNSKEALEIAKFNAYKHNLKNRIEFLLSNWYDQLDSYNKLFDIIVSNPPYISEYEKPLMSKETILYEPDSALYAEEEGLINYKYIISKAKEYLKPKGMIFLEIGFNQQNKVASILQDYRFELLKSLKDLGGNDRIMLATSAS